MNKNNNYEHNYMQDTTHNLINKFMNIHEINH